MSGRPFFVNVHIPKCGGTTFRTILHRNFRGRCEQAYNLIWEKPYTAKQLAFFIGDSPGYDCLSSHRTSLDLPFDDASRDVIAIAFVRDPIERLFSHYFYERSRAYQRERYANLRDMTPEQFVDYVLTDKREQYLFDYQYRHLMVGVGDPSFEFIESLVVRGRLLPFPLERFDESLLVLRSLHPEQFTDLRYVRQNTSDRDQVVDPALHDRLRGRMDRDVRLHLAASAWLDAQIDERFADRAAFDAELTAMRRACRRYELFRARPTAWAKRVLRRVGRVLGT